jgi:hypothetical protein
MARGLTRDLLLQTCELLVLRMYVFCARYTGYKTGVYIRSISLEVRRNVMLTACFYCYGKQTGGITFKLMFFFFFNSNFQVWYGSDLWRRVADPRYRVALKKTNPVC